MSGIKINKKSKNLRSKPLGIEAPFPFLEMATLPFQNFRRNLTEPLFELNLIRWQVFSQPIFLIRVVIISRLRRIRPVWLK